MRFTHARRCQIAKYATQTGPVPYCGRPATWFSDDVSRDGSTVWMCDRHQAEVARSLDDGTEFGREAS
jgi:hypothetical protein